MTRRSLADAKAHLSKLVDAAEHRRVKTVITRHGKPVAAIVPLDVAFQREQQPKPQPMSRKEMDALWAQFGQGSPESAVEDLLKGRR